MAYCAVYLNRVYRERNMPEKPEDPLIQEKDIPYDADFTFVDIVPSVLAYSSQEVEYHRFSHLIERANYWLRRNSHWKLINCETVKLLYRHNLTNMVSRWEQQINPATAMWSGSQLRTNEYETSLKVLRLWIRRKDIDEEDLLESLLGVGGVGGHQNLFSVTLKHLDFVPQRQLGSNSTFESVDEVLARLNERLARPDARRWNLVSLQSLKVEANSDWVHTDPEVSLAEESSRYIIVLRLFYEDFTFGNAGEGGDGGGLGGEDFCDKVFNSQVTIGIEDFKPRHLSGGSFFKRPQFEPFSALVQRSARWLTSQSGVQFLNAQSIDIKVKSLSKVESRLSSHIEHGDYIQILRVIFLKVEPVASTSSTTNSSSSSRPPRPHSAQVPGSRGDGLSSPVPPPPSSLTLAVANPLINSRTETSAAASLRLGAKVVLTTKFEHPLDSLQARIHSWLRAQQQQQQQQNQQQQMANTGGGDQQNSAPQNSAPGDVFVLSAETVDIYGKDDDERNLERALEDCFQPGRLGSLNMYAFTAIRLFYAVVPSREAVERAAAEKEWAEKNEKSEKSALGKSTLSLSAGLSHNVNNNNNNTPKLSRDQQQQNQQQSSSATLTKRQRWSKYASAAAEMNARTTTSSSSATNTKHHLRHQSSTVEHFSSPKQHSRLLTRRPTSQFDSVVISAALAERAAAAAAAAATAKKADKGGGGGDGLDGDDLRFEKDGGGGQMRLRSNSTSCNCM